MRSVIAVFAVVIALGYWTTHVQAHFIWVASEAGVARIYFGEGLEADQAGFLDRLAGMQVYRAVDGKWDRVHPERRTDGAIGWFELANEGDSPVIIHCDYGLFSRGEKSMRLDYAAKYLSDRMSSPALEGPFRLDLTASYRDGKLVLKATFDGQPAPDVEIILEGASSETVNTNKDGAAEIAIAPADRFVLRAKKILAEPGEVSGAHYDEHRFYCTLVLDMAKESSAQDDRSLPDLPVSLTSFGGTEMDGKIYVYGGQMGDAHSYARTWQNGKLFCLDRNLPEPGWTVEYEGSGLQGLALVPYRGRLLHVGGFEARNAVGEAHNLHSVAAFRAFDVQQRTWSDLPPLPEPRSSFDACVLGDQLFVIGGWTLRGSEETRWCDSALVIRLDQPEAQWSPMPTPPFQRRALSVVACDSYVMAIGGMDAEGKTSNAVNVFDTDANRWLPESTLPDTGDMKGFGCTAFVLDGDVVVSLADGSFYRHEKATGEWQRLAAVLDPGRFFHRVFPVSNSRVIVVGGANMEIGKFQSIERIDFGQRNTDTKTKEGF